MNSNSNITAYHAKYFAYELTKRCAPDSVEKLAGAVASARATGSRTADMRSALVDYFREQGRIMIATEAEGINLQFCSLVVNYDPLAEALLAQAKARDLLPAEIFFDYGQHGGKITLLEPLIGKSGWLTLSLFSVESLDQAEDHLIIAAETDEGQTLEEAVAARLLTLPGRLIGQGQANSNTAQLDTNVKKRQTSIQHNISERNACFFDAEADKLDGWADDLKLGLEREIKEIDRQIKEARRAVTTALTLEGKLAGQKQIKALEAHRNQKRRTLFDAQDQVDSLREKLIAQIEGKLMQTTQLQQLFMLRWTLK